MSNHWIRTSLAALAIAGLAASASARAVVYVRVAPPPVVVEERSVAPSPHHVWVAGYHRWDGSTYVWVPGAWQERPRERARWVNGRWRHSRRGWYWSDGRWR